MPLPEYRSKNLSGGLKSRINLERETGFEPATSTLARSHSTTELLPLAGLFYFESRESNKDTAKLTPLRRQNLQGLQLAQVEA